MDIHKNARLTPHGRERLAKMIVGGQTPQAASEAAGVCPRTGRKWRDRFEQEGLAGLQDRSSRPHRLRKPTPPEVIEHIASLRRQRMPGKEIATTVGGPVTLAFLWCNSCFWEIDQAQLDKPPWSESHQRYRCPGCHGRVEWHIHGPAWRPDGSSAARPPSSPASGP